MAVLHLEIRTRGFDASGKPLEPLASIGAIQLETNPVVGGVNELRGKVALSDVLIATSRRIDNDSITLKGDPQSVTIQMISGLLKAAHAGSLDIENAKLYDYRDGTKILQVKYRGT